MPNLPNKLLYLWWMRECIIYKSFLLPLHQTTVEDYRRREAMSAKQPTNPRRPKSQLNYMSFDEMMMSLSIYSC